MLGLVFLDQPTSCSGLPVVCFGGMYSRTFSNQGAWFRKVQMGIQGNITHNQIFNDLSLTGKLAQWHWILWTKIWIFYPSTFDGGGKRGKIFFPQPSISLTLGDNVFQLNI
jgi:hypothetical protein